MGAELMMLARVALAFFSIGRDVEGAESLARLMEVGHAMAVETGLANGTAQASVWQPVMALSGLGGGAPPAVDALGALALPVIAPEGRGGVQARVRAARDHANAVRDLLPTDLWESLNEIHLEIADWSEERLDQAGVYAFCRSVRRAANLVHGVADQMMCHDEGWQFLRLGRSLERAAGQTRLLDATVRAGLAARSATGPEAEVRALRALLSSAGAYYDFMRKVSVSIEPDAVAHYLVMEARSPRSIRCALNEVHDSLAALAAAGAIPAGSAALGAARAACGDLDAAGDVAADARLRALLETVLARCDGIGAAIDTDCFARSPDGLRGALHAQAEHQTQN
ncbi:MAG: alpha-E domain-containing protein [Actinomycetota bacterium]